MLRKFLLSIIVMFLSLNVFAGFNNNQSCSKFYNSKNYIKYEVYFGKMNGSKCLYSPIGLGLSYEGANFEYSNNLTEKQRFEQLISFLGYHRVVDENCSVMIFHDQSNKTCEITGHFEVENNTPVHFKIV